jgi:CheY-like chemotaxis protein
MRYRIALCGFSEFEYRAMQFSFLHPTGFHESEYDIVDALEEADFAVVDADSQPAVKAIVQSGRLPQAVFVGASAPEGAAWHLKRPIDTSRILRTLDELTSSQTVPAAFRDVPMERVFPTLDDVVDEPAPDPLAPPDIWVDIPTEAAPTPAPTSPPPVPRPALASEPAPAAGPGVDAAARRALQSLAKAAARAAARRARQASAQAAAGAVEPLRDVLVMDADRIANTLLCALLERFGFEARSVYTVAQADAELLKRAYAAVFLDIALDEVGVDLLQRIRALPQPTPHPSTAVVMVTAHMDPAERVRAALAGVTAPLVKPLGRGDVARALESVGVVLPSDARRL